MAQGNLIRCYEAIFVFSFICLLTCIILFAGMLSVYSYMEATIGFWIFTFIGLFLIVIGFFMSRRRKRWRQKSRKDKTWRKMTTPPIIQWIYLGFVIAFLLLFAGSIVWITQSKYKPLSDLSLEIRGQLSHESATFLVRNPSRSSVVLEYRPKGLTTWRSLNSYALIDDNDKLATLTAIGLKPETSYEYRFVYDDSAEISGIRSFTTRPIPAPDTNYSFNFTFGSCIYSNPQTQQDLYGIKQITALGTFDFNLFLGDFIYHEHPFPLDNDLDYFRYQYRTVYNKEDVRNYFGSSPSYFMFDDHELKNNWDQGIQGFYPDAIKAWQGYCGSLNPSGFNSSQKTNARYFNFDIGSVSFFISDTRTFRAPNSMADGPDKIMLGESQLQDLFNWLIAKNSSSIKFIGSSVPFSDWAPSIDTWQTRQYEKNRIIDFITENHINGVVFLTGDRHWSGVFQIRKGIYEFTISPMDAFASSPTVVDASTTPEKLIWWGKKNRFFGFVKVDPKSDNIIELSIHPLDQDPISFTFTKDELIV